MKGRSRSRYENQEASALNEIKFALLLGKKRKLRKGETGGWATNGCWKGGCVCERERERRKKRRRGEEKRKKEKGGLEKVPLSLH